MSGVKALPIVQYTGPLLLDPAADVKDQMPVEIQTYERGDANHQGRPL